MEQSILDRIALQKQILYGDTGVQCYQNPQKVVYRIQIEEKNDPFAENYDEYAYDLQQQNEYAEVLMEDLPEPIHIPIQSPDIPIEFEENNQVSHFIIDNVDSSEAPSESQILDVIYKQKGQYSYENFDKQDNLDKEIDQKNTKLPKVPIKNPSVNKLTNDFRQILVDQKIMSQKIEPDFSNSQTFINNQDVIHKIIFLNNPRQTDFIDDILNLPVSRPE
ncbi:hypothetical protein SS50377_26315 [Spironucleus salmonicida]|uniref:Uncharacterized protein n=1 Tax=Spironucleus salmonicida TaxID=348837 RepID=V6LU85_9EUKA|nr:hypothetical protein SS50377_26315 [Spironucleus salmonicida]|eukprot:EST47818.1 Hypothetical protein SS50377_12220 [Spironucleus salmonicida]